MSRPCSSWPNRPLRGRSPCTSGDTAGGRAPARDSVARVVSVPHSPTTGSKLYWVYGVPIAARTAERTAIGPRLLKIRRCRRCASPGNSDMTPLTISVLTPKAAAVSATATPSPSGSSQSATINSYSSEPRQRLAALTLATVSTVYPSPRNTSARISRAVGSSSTSRMRFTTTSTQNKRGAPRSRVLPC